MGDDSCDGMTFPGEPRVRGEETIARSAGGSFRITLDKAGYVRHYVNNRQVSAELYRDAMATVSFGRRGEK